MNSRSDSDLKLVSSCLLRVTGSNGYIESRIAFNSQVAFTTIFTGRQETIRKHHNRQRLSCLLRSDFSAAASVMDGNADLVTSETSKPHPQCANLAPPTAQLINSSPLENGSRSLIVVALEASMSHLRATSHMELEV